MIGQRLNVLDIWHWIIVDDAIPHHLIAALQSLSEDWKEYVIRPETEQNCFLSISAGARI
jgi:hypothetical protein